ncbi:MAG TPA: hypothetical protein VE053_12150 [Allosphingosinicella sp.]|nr:hypothetical protein [Allosphingosinicella sp.]
MKLLLALAGLAAPAVPAPVPAPAPSEAPPPLKCEKGPLNRTFGGTAWHVFGCEDKATLVFWAATGNPAAPFYFISFPKGGTRELYGEGTGDKKATAPAFEDLKRLDAAAIGALLAAVEQAGAAPAPEPAQPPGK